MVTFGELLFWNNKFLAAILIYWFYSQVSKRSKYKFRGIKLIIFSAILSLILFSTSITLSNYFFNPGIIGDFISFIIVFLILQFLISVILINKDSVFAERDEHESVKKRLNRVESLVNRFLEIEEVSKTINAGISRESAINKIKYKCNIEGYGQEFIILKEENESDSYFFEIGFKYHSFNVRINKLTGEIISFNHVRKDLKTTFFSLFDLVKRKPLTSFGVSLILFLVILNISLNNEMYNNEVSELLSLEYVREQNETTDFEDILKNVLNNSFISSFLIQEKS